MKQGIASKWLTTECKQLGQIIEGKTFINQGIRFRFSQCDIQSKSFILLTCLPTDVLYSIVSSPSSLSCVPTTSTFVGTPFLKVRTIAASCKLRDSLTTLCHAAGSPGRPNHFATIMKSLRKIGPPMENTSPV